MLKNKLNVVEIKAIFTTPLVTKEVSVVLERSPNYRQMQALLTHFMIELKQRSEDPKKSPFDATFDKMFRKELHQIYSELVSNEKLLRVYKAGHTQILYKHIKVKGFVK